MLDQREIIEREIQSTAWKGEITDVLRHYQKRQQEQHYVPRKYQPVILLVSERSDGVDSTSQSFAKGYLPL